MKLTGKQKEQLRHIIGTSTKFLYSLLDEEQEQDDEGDNGDEQVPEDFDPHLDKGEPAPEPHPDAADEPEPKQTEETEASEGEETQPLDELMEEEAQKRIEEAREEIKQEAEQEPEKKSKKGKGKKKAEPEPEPTPEPVEEEPAVTGDEGQGEAVVAAEVLPPPPKPPDVTELLAEARNAAIAYAGKRGREDLRTLLNKYTKGTVAEVPVDKLPELIFQLKALQAP